MKKFLLLFMMIISSITGFCEVASYGKLIYNTSKGYYFNCAEDKNGDAIQFFVGANKNEAFRTLNELAEICNVKDDLLTKISFDKKSNKFLIVKVKRTHKKTVANVLYIMPYGEKAKWYIIEGELYDIMKSIMF